MDKPDISQQTHLIRQLKDDMRGKIEPEYLDGDKLYDMTTKITIKQYKYILALLYNKKYEDIKQFIQYNVTV